MSDIRFAGSYRQGTTEHIPYAIDTTGWGGAPTTVSFKVLKYALVGLYTDVTTTNAPGSASVTGNIITLPKLGSITIGTMYRVEVAFTSGGADWVSWFEVRGER
jgi:hypothetical protein